MMTTDEKIARLMVESANAAADYLPHYLLDRCQSEIERLMGVALWTRGCWTGRSTMLGVRSLQELLELASRYRMVTDFMHVCIESQIEVGRYRLDFVVVGYGFETGKPYLLGIECDGHDFHEKTKAQAARDKSRDRRMMSAGIPTLRFTGSEIWRDAGACAEEVFSYFQAKWQEELEISLDKHSAVESAKTPHGKPDDYIPTRHGEEAAE